MTFVNPLSMVGLMLTLASLMGSFFYFQLSQWLRDLTGLQTKIRLNKHGNDTATVKAVQECRAEHSRLTSPPVWIVNIAVIWFVSFVLQSAFAMIEMARTDPLYFQTYWAMVVFRRIFLVLAIGQFLWGDYLTASTFRALRAVNAQ